MSEKAAVLSVGSVVGGATALHKCPWSAQLQSRMGEVVDPQALNRHFGQGSSEGETRTLNLAEALEDDLDQPQLE